ncbi:sensor histidine kinase [Aestuariibacter sp. GS-14]|uniref:sensor histidine kinase n=1 Tax=Aestuariibacter sp. GS-14 TaxID=2590670 RepID=UPI00112A921F|nr:ATP-binding protein [Aestuariibacter sp. GS-14]TPV60753.1 sensor histidine kinase [Aestuariibacter sp. GS-14]
MFRVITTILFVCYLMAVGLLAYTQVIETVKARAEQDIQDVASKLDIELDKYRTLPRVLVLHPAIVEVLNTPDPQNVQRVNYLLHTYNQSLTSDAVYLLSATGLTLASSNWEQPDSFVGNDYGFRPYFQQALSGQEGSYFALGTVSGKRGYYFSFPVRSEQRIIGALVVKVALSVIEDYRASAESELMVTDDHGAVFYSSHSDWNYSSLVTLPETVRAEIIHQKQYGTGPIPLLTQQDSLDQLLEQDTLSLQYNAQKRTYLIADKTMSQVGWHLIVLTPINQAYVLMGWILIGASVLFVLIALLSMSWRRNIIAQRQLAAVNEQLEHRVEQRTAQLQQTNSTLVDIIEKQRKTELRLKETQNELIQAGKLALLGEMSASINHELNQPLTALRTYSETLRLMINKGKTESFGETTDEIIKLIHKMATIVAQYKLFARKSAGKTGPVRLADTIDASLSILESKINKMHAVVQVEAFDQSLQVIAEAVPLEQVLVNILNNALQAQDDQPNPQIHVTVQENGPVLHLTVRDFGPGFNEEQLNRVFEPFFTTKGRGLGLGLTISQRIMASFDGDIQASNHPEQGAVFTLTLPINTEKVT